MQKVLKIATVCIALFVATTFVGGNIGNTLDANAKSKNSTTQKITTKQFVRNYTLSENKPLTVYSSLLSNDYYSHTEYFKLKPSKTGRITISASNVDIAYVYLCDSNKKVISSRNYYNSASSLHHQRQINYGVKKGKTYYIKVDGLSPINEVQTYPYWNFNYTLKYTNTRVKEKSGSKKSKAKRIKRNKYRYGTIVAGSGTKDWYKFYNNKETARKITYKGKTNDRLRMTIYCRGYSRTWTDKCTMWDSDNDRSQSTSIYMPPGNVYIKVERRGKGSSGTYGIKWK